MNKVIRSLLFVPGSKPGRFEKALNAGADLVCIDLEDAVLPSDKLTAREAVINAVRHFGRQLCVRVNPLSSPLGVDDLLSLAKVQPQFVMLAKCDSVEHIDRACELLENTETRIIALIETIEGLAQAANIAARSDRVTALMFGGADLSAELRCDFTYEPLLHVRSQLVLAAASAGKDLIDVPFVNIKDDAGLLAETQKIKALGFTAKAAIHPCQINTIHRAFCPTDAQIEKARAIQNAVNGQDDAGVVVVNGQMVDRPIILAAKRTLQLASAADNEHVNEE